MNHSLQCVMKIAFYIDNENHIGVDYSTPEKGNPGIGGTHYMFWSIAYYIKKIDQKIDVFIFAPIIDTMPSILKCKKCLSPIDAVRLAKEMGVDILILRGPNSKKDLFDEISIQKQKVVFWSHNFEDYKFATLAANNQYVMRNVCVGKEQMDRLRDHPLFDKTTYIYNAIDFNLYEGYERTNHSKIVGYMGSLTSKKGFHRLARVWKEVLKQVPDAQLYVLGGGNLYGKKWKTGKLNLTNEKYEKKITHYLADANGNIIPSVKFLGVVSGKEKLQLLNQLNVGVANPIGSETFCIVAIEYEYLRIPVVTVKKNGVLDTVIDKKTGYLFNNDKEFINSIVYLLNHDEEVDKLGNNGRNFVISNFGIHEICQKWIQLFEEIMNSSELKVSYNASNWFNNFKWLREINRRLKKTKIFHFLPPIIWYKQIVRDCYKYIKNGTECL